MSIKLILFTFCIFLMWFFCKGQWEREYHHPDILKVGFQILNDPKYVDDWISMKDRVRAITEKIDSVSKQLAEYDREHPEWLDLSRLLAIYGIPYNIPQQCQTFDKYTTNETVKRIVERECGKDLLLNIQFVTKFRKQIKKINEYIGDVMNEYDRLKHNYEMSSPYINAPNDLYKFIDGICQDYKNSTSCFFHQVAGNHFPLIRGGKRFHPTRSIHQEIYLIYLKITIALLKGHAAKMFYYMRQYSRDEAMNRIEISRTTFAIHASNIAKLTKSALEIAPRDIRPGDPLIHKEDTTYIRLKWFAEQFLVNEANLNPTATCSNTCEDYHTTTYYHYGDVPSNRTDICTGVIYRCYAQQLGHLCPSADPNSRRYGGIQGFKNLGDTHLCANKSYAEDLYYVKSCFFNRCDVCTCYCDDFKNPKTVRAFHLGQVTSDIANNMVITGVRLKEKNGLIYIEIQQGKLLKLGLIDKTSVHWVPLNISDPQVYSNNYTLHYLFEKSVSLHTISTSDFFVREYIQKKTFNRGISPELAPNIDSYVMTGIKFGSNYWRINLSARFHAIDKKTGRLIVNDAWDGWIINKESPYRYEMEIKEPHIPIYGPEENIEVPDNDIYVRFRASDNTKDFGQTTVPFLESQQVISNPPIPLSGAGIYYKGQKGYGGFIGLKLLSHDFSQFISTELNYYKD